MEAQKDPELVRRPTPGILYEVINTETPDLMLLATRQWNITALVDVIISLCVLDARHLYMLSHKKRVPYPLALVRHSIPGSTQCV